MNAVEQSLDYERVRSKTLGVLRSGFPAVQFSTLEDVVHDVLTTTLEKRSPLERPSDAYILTACRSRLLDELRRVKRQATPTSFVGADGDLIEVCLDTASGDHAQARTPLQQVLASEKSDRRQDALAQTLRDFARECESTNRYHWRVVFEARGILGWSARQTAKFANVSEQTVNNTARSTKEWIEKRLRRSYDIRGSLFESRYRIIESDALEEPRALASKSSGDSTFKGHLTVAVMRELLADQLSESDASKARSHLRGCKPCRRTIERLEADLFCRDETRLQLQHLRDDLGALCFSSDELSLIRQTSGDPGGVRQLAFSLHTEVGKCSVCHRGGRPS